jgi:hypothetical protein
MNLESIQSFFTMIHQERSWSWSVIGIVYLVMGLLIRRLFLAPLIRRAKDLNRSTYEAFRSSYLKRSFLGWLFFLISFVTVIVLWNQQIWIPLTVTHALGVLAAVVSYMISILCHIEAIGIAALVTLRRLADKSAES